MDNNHFQDFESLLPTDSFYRNSDIIREYGSEYEFFILNSVLVKDEELFYRYKNEDMITADTQSGTKSISKHLLIDLLSIEGLYRYLITNFDNELSVAIRLDLFDKGEIKCSIQISRADLSLFFKKIDPKELNQQQRMRIALITNITSLYSLEQKYHNYVHTANIDGEIVSIPARELIKLLTSDEITYNIFVYGSNVYKYTKQEMVYMLNDFFSRERVLEKYLLPVDIFNRYKNLVSNNVIDYESLNKNLKTNDNDIDGASIVDKVKIDYELEDEIYKYIKPQYSKLEIAIYLYVRLCELLTYDQEYFANSNDLDEKNRHNSIEVINKITLENNSVTNYEFLLIYANLLKKVGIKYTLDNSLLSGNTEGCSITFRESEFLVEANAIQDVINNDMTNAKINAPLTGLCSLNKSSISRRKFDETYFKIVQELIEKKTNQQLFEDSLKQYHDKYSSIDLPLTDKIYVLLKEIARPDLKGVDTILYQRKIFDKLFGNDENIRINFVSSMINSYKNYVYTPITIISLFTGSMIKYYVIDSNAPCVISSITKEELTELFMSKDYMYIDFTSEPIMGLELESGVSYVR